MPRRLLLLGGGPAHRQVLAAFAREPLAGAELALLTPDARLVPPAWCASFVAGSVAAADCGVDTATLAAAAGATWWRGRVAAFDAAACRVTLQGGDIVEADLVSIDEPGAADRDALPGAREHALALHPAAPFVALFDGLVALAAERPLDVVVIGADADAVELALALAERLGGRRGAGERLRIALVAGGGELLAGWPEAARRPARAALARARITVFHEPCQALLAGTAVLASGARLACDAALLATPPQPPPWLRDSALALDAGGVLQVDARLQAPGHAALFGPGAAGEAAAPALAAQLRRALASAPLPTLPLRAPALRWLRCGHGRAVAVWGPVVLSGLAVGAWRRQRDRRQRERWRLPALGAGPAAA
jgi:NADH dehydrogenase FAD-containing subunit